MTVLVLAVTIALVVSFVCSLSEAVLLSVTRVQIEALESKRVAGMMRRFKDEIDTPISAIVVLNTFANTIGGAVSGAKYMDLFGERTLLAFSITFTVTILLLSEILPKTLGVLYAGALAVPVAYYVRGLIVVLRPVLFLTRGVSGLLRRGRAQPVTSVDEIRLLASMARTEGVLTERTAEMIEGATALRELTAYDVMVPRNGVVAFSGERTLEQNLALARQSGHSRFPFTPDGDLDKVEGVVLIKDVLFRQREEQDALDWKALLDPLLVVPSSMPLERLLRTFQEERRHLALVVDEYGGTQGLVTMEDVLEEIVGEIEDESDRVDPHIVRRPDESLVCRGWAETRKVFELLGLEEGDENEMVTIGGFVAELVGRVPRVGDEVDHQGYRFTVLRASARRAERIEVRKVPPGVSLRPPPERPSREG
ncbi:MAG: hemolysin family protein [Sorangiineae bacterium]|nr:hemolysin family protein [Polyangiaceae bacterium]MEB2323731.1 hemolysin family protein [Sorangiineae bacterium]